MSRIKTRKRIPLQRSRLNCVELLEDRCLLSANPVGSRDPETVAPLHGGVIAAVTATAPSATITVQPLTALKLATTTEHKPMSKVWTHDGKWWTVLADRTGTWVWRLDGQKWTQVLKLDIGAYLADVKDTGDVAHVLLFTAVNKKASKVASIEYVRGNPGTYKMWSQHPTLTSIVFPTGVEAATIDMDSKGRLWIGSDGSTTVEARYSEFPYTSWSPPIFLAAGISKDDICVLTALPNGSIGVMWSNQTTQRFGFRVRSDESDPNSLSAWSPDEVPASQSAINDGLGMADDHLNVAVASDGTLYAAVKHGYSTGGLPSLSLLVRRPTGTWDRAYTVSTASSATRPIVVLNEVQHRLLVMYDNFFRGGVYYKDSPTASISFGNEQTIMTGPVANVTSTKQNWTNEVVAIASGSAVLLTTGLRADAGPDQNMILSGQATLHAGITLNGQPAPPSTFTTTWTKLSGPGDVTFGDASKIDTTARFSAAGTYVLRVTTNDGVLPATDDVMITAATSGSLSFQDGVFPTPAYAGTRDTFITPPTPAKGNKPPVVKINGSATTLVNNGLIDNASLLKWDLTSVPPGTKLKAASITLNFTKGAAASYEVYAMNRDWAEDQAHWDEFAAGSPWETAGAQGAGDHAAKVLGTITPMAIGTKGLGPQTFTLNADGLATLQSWIDNPSLNHGFIIQDYANTKKEIDFSSHEAAAAANHPKLTLNYEANLAPVLAPIGDKVLNPGELLSFAISATDANNDPLSYSATGLPASATFDLGTRTVTWRPTAAEQGTYHVTFRASDGVGTASETIAIAVGAPGLLPIGGKSTDEGSLLSFRLVGADSNGDSLTYSASGLPADATLDSTTGIFNWTAGENQDGTHNVRFGVSDGFTTITEMVTITVAEVNQAPTLAIDSKAVNEGSALSFAIAATDADLVNGSPNALTYAAVNLPGGAAFDTATRTFNWTPSESQDGSQSATFSVSDGTSAVQTTVAISVTEVNQAPVLAPIGSRAVQEGVLLNFTVSATDADLVNGSSNTLTFSATNLPTGATFDPATRIFNWTPAGNQDGTYNVKFSVSDGVASHSRTITIAVGAPLLSPIGNKSVDEGQRVNFTVSATDAGGDPLTYSAVGVPTGATFDATSHTFDWAPTEVQDGTYTLTFNISDGTSTVSETITLTVAEVNQTPDLAAIGAKSLNEGSQLSFSMSAADPDVVAGVANSVTYSATGLPSGATLNASTGAFKWTPGENQDGTFTVVFKASDGTATDTETVTITVAELNQSPVMSAIGAKSLNEASNLNFKIAGTDADLVNGSPNTLTFSASGLPSGAAFDASSRTFDWNPAEGQDGTYNVTFALSDGTTSVSEVVTVTVHEVNSAPVLGSIGNKSINELTQVNFALSASDSDVVSGVPNTLTLTASGVPSGANFDAANRTFTWTPSENQDGSFNVTFNVNDGATTVSETITISVAEVNTAPVLARIGDRSVNIGSTLTITASATDVDFVGGVQNALTYSIVGLPSGATFDADTHAVSWTPIAGQAGTYLVKFRVSDGKALVFETIAITVNQGAVGAHVESRDGAVDQALADTHHGSGQASVLRLQGLLDELTAELTH